LAFIYGVKISLKKNPYPSEAIYISGNFLGYWKVLGKISLKKNPYPSEAIYISWNFLGYWKATRKRSPLRGFPWLLFTALKYQRKNGYVSKAIYISWNSLGYWRVLGKISLKKNPYVSEAICS
jgi:hypothetical protein